MFNSTSGVSKLFLFKVFKIFIYFYECVCVGACTYAHHRCPQRSEDVSDTLVFSSQHVGARK